MRPGNDFLDLLPGCSREDDDDEDDDEKEEDGSPEPGASGPVQAQSWCPAPRGETGVSGSAQRGITATKVAQIRNPKHEI